MLYAIMAKYAYKVEGDINYTIIMARKAMSMMPSNMNHHLNLVKYLIWSGNQIEAKQALESAERVDINRQHTTEIARLKKTLETK